MRFLGYIVSYQGIQIEEKQITVIYNGSKLQLVCDIQVFLGFANFYWQFIKRFSRLAIPLTFMLKKTLAADLEDENLEQSGQKIQVDDWNEKKPAQKSCKS